MLKRNKLYLPQKVSFKEDKKYNDDFDMQILHRLVRKLANEITNVKRNVGEE